MNSNDNTCHSMRGNPRAVGLVFVGLRRFANYVRHLMCGGEGDARYTI